MAALPAGTQSINTRVNTPHLDQGGKTVSYNKYLQAPSSIPANKWHRVLDINDQIQTQRTPFANRNTISRGSISTVAGGNMTFYSATGGTKILTYDPYNGAVTIAGELIQENVTTGIYSGITLEGVNTLSGTIAGGTYTNPIINGGTYTNPIINGGTVNAAAYDVNGAPGITANIQYIESVNFISSTFTYGTINVVNGLVVGYN